MKIIVLGPDYGNYIAASYQYQFLKALKKSSNKYYHYNLNKEISVDKLIRKSGFTPDIVLYNHGWLSDNINGDNITYTKINGLFPINTKQIIFINKEYSRLKEKLYEIKQYKFDLILTHLHDFEKLNTSKIKSIFLPMAINKNFFNKNNKRKLNARSYDIYFSGILQNWFFKNKQSDIRKKIQKELFYCIYDFPILKKIKHRKLKIYWKPIYGNFYKSIISDLFHGKRLSYKDYLIELTKAKCVLHTASPIGIMSTRIFEALGSGSIGLFHEQTNADVLFEKNKHYINFSNVDDFINKVYLIKESSRDKFYQEIAINGRKKVEDEHTWENRITFLKEQIYKLWAKQTKSGKID